MNDCSATPFGLSVALELIQSDRCPYAFSPGFPAWLAKNWHVYVEFERVAVRLSEVTKHGSAYAIWETLRYRTAVGELDSAFKLNNLYRADCSRLAAILQPRLIDFFERRRRGIVSPQPVAEPA